MRNGVKSRDSAGPWAYNTGFLSTHERPGPSRPDLSMKPVPRGRGNRITGYARPATRSATDLRRPV